MGFIAQVYPINRHLPRGRVLIINNFYFLDPQLVARYGATIDGKNLKELFEQLSFTVEIHENLCTEDMGTLFEAESARADHANASMFILFILSHGRHGNVYGIDAKKLSIENDITSFFTPDKAPLLSGKPKIFFIEASKGGYLNNEDEEGFVPGYFKKADIVMNYAAIQGCPAWRRTDLGSWFVRCLVHVFSQRAHSEHLLDMLTEVNSLLSKLKTKDGYGQLAETSHTLTKKLYLFP